MFQQETINKGFMPLNVLNGVKDRFLNKRCVINDDNVIIIQFTVKLKIELL